MRQSVFLWSVVAGTAMLLACNAILDFDAYAVRPDAGNADSGPSVEECTTNQECITKIGDFSICKKATHTCMKLLSPECPKILGNWKSDDAVILGAIQPLLGSDAAAGIPTENAIGVAVDDFTQGSNGLPPMGGSGRRRPIAVVSCTEATEDPNDSDAPLRSAKHLIDVGVPAIIGAAYSGDTLRISERTINAGVLLMSPTATSVALSQLDPLVWRTSPSDTFQASALTAVMPQIEAQARKRASLADNDPLRVWILNKGDTYGKGLAAALTSTLRYNGKGALEQVGTSFVIKDYGDPDSQQPPTSYPERKADVLKAIQDGVEPHVAFLLGTTEVVTELLAGIEEMSAWTEKSKVKPMYLLADGGLVPELWDYIGTKSELRTRVFGTIPGTNNDNFQTFKLLYESKIKDGTSPAVGGAANAYDALYVIAYAIASLGDEAVTGANIAKGLRRVVGPGSQVRPGSNNINTALAALTAGRNIDYDGASGPLDFELDKGEAASDIQLWCVPEQGGKAAAAINSGVFYDATKSGLNDLKLYPPSAAVVSTCALPTPTP